MRTAARWDARSNWWRWTARPTRRKPCCSFSSLPIAKVHFFFQGNSSAVAGALTDAVAKHNARNPENPMLFFNYGAVDPALTNDRCNFWHFRFDADANMKMAALINYLATQKKVKKIYLINQDYAFGQAVSKAAREMLAEKRPDIQIVGDDLHPLGKVKDFAPYVAKIKASGADAVLTGNWGADLSLLIKAGKEAGLNVNYYTYYAGIAGSPGGHRRGRRRARDAGQSLVQQRGRFQVGRDGERVPQTLS